MPIRESALAIFTVIGRDTIPHGGDEDDVLECYISAEFAEHIEIPCVGSGKSFRDAVGVGDPGKLRPFLVPVKELGPEDRETTNTNVYLRSGQESCDRIQDIRIAL